MSASSRHQNDYFISWGYRGILFLCLNLNDRSWHKAADEHFANKVFTFLAGLAEIMRVLPFLSVCTGTMIKKLPLSYPDLPGYSDSPDKAPAPVALPAYLIAAAGKFPVRPEIVLAAG